jgi:hypothetical protein
MHVQASSARASWQNQSKTPDTAGPSPLYRRTVVTCLCKPLILQNLGHNSSVSAFKRPSRPIENGMELFSHVVVMGGLLLSVLVKLGSKGTCCIVDKLASSTCRLHQM